MKTIKIFIAVAAAICAGACQKVNEITPSASTNEITITAYADATKTALQNEEGQIFWEVGDKINVFYNKVGGEFTSTATSPAAISQFTGTLDVIFGAADGTADSHPYWAVYPYNSANSSTDNGVTIYLPSIQTAKAGTFAQNAFTSIGTSKTQSIGFYSVCGGVRFTVTRNDITSVKFRGLANEKIAGKADVSFKEGVPCVDKIYDNGGEKVISLIAPEGECLVPGQYYYIAIAPGELASGYEFTFSTGKKEGKIQKTTAVTVKRGIFGTVSEADKNVEFVDKTWSDPTIVNVEAGTLAFEIDPKTDKPVLAVVKNEGSSRGPVLIYPNIEGTPVTVTPAGNVNQYIALGIDANGKSYVYTQNYTSKKGEIYTSEDYSTYTNVINNIDQTNAYYGSSIGCLGSEVYMMTCNSANTTGGIQKRNINVTKFNGSTWSTGNILAGRPVKNTYYPVIRNHKGNMYTFVTNVSEGFTIYKYDGSNWSDVITVSATSEEFKKFSYGVNEPQDMTFAPDGQIWMAIGTASPYGAAVIKIDPTETSDNISQIGDSFPLTNSISARSARIGVSPDANGKTYLVFRDDNQCLNVSTLNDDTYEWNTPVKLTSASSGDINIRFTKSGDAYIVCTTSNHVEIFKSL